MASALGALALALAAVGLYGVFTYFVTQRTREIGLRLALGSQVGDVLWMVIREALWLVSLGIGGGAALAGASFVSKQLYGVTPTDPLTCFISVAAMLVMTVLAISLPAWRASRIEPMVALRQD